MSVNRKIEYGDLEKGFAESDYVREDTFTVHAASHAYLEPCSALAQRDQDGRITLWTSTQVPYIVQCLLASTLGMRENDVRVIKPYRGRRLRRQDGAAVVGVLRGLHGQEDRPAGEVHPHPGRGAGRRPAPPPHEAPVQGGLQEGRHPGGQGPADHSWTAGPTTPWGPRPPSCAATSGPCSTAIPNYRFHGQHVYTNKPPASAMRGFGAPQSLFVDRNPDEHGRRGTRHRPDRAPAQERHGAPATRSRTWPPSPVAGLSSPSRRWPR